MNIKQKTITLLTICLLLFSAFAIITRNYTTTVHAQNGAELTGITTDSGKDTDGDGKYDYLEVAVEINVSDAGNYRIEASYLVDENDTWLYLFTYTESYLDEGVQLLNLSFYGPAIYAAHFSPKNISWIELYDYYHEFLDDITDVQLFQTYSYTDFDCAATLTGTVYEEEIDSDYDGLLDALQIGVEIEVVENATYMVTVESLSGDYTYVPVYNSSAAFLTAGIQTINVSVYGPKIFSYLYDSQGNISYVSFSLSVEEDYQYYFIDSRWDVPLSKTYYYYEFESHAFFTGNIIDHGVDEDGDGLFDYLEVAVEVNVTETGSYRISLEGLRGEKNNSTETIYHPHYFDLDLDTNIHTVNFTFPGPMIAYYHLNPTNITDLRLAELPDDYQLAYLSMAPLSAKYNYTQFNPPFNDMEIEFTVYPNATIDVSGNFNHTNIYPPLNSPLFNATIGFSTNGDITTSSANGTMIPPEYEKSQWPLNSTIASLLTEYYNDILTAELNATVFMPPEANTACPFNSSAGDFTFIAEYLNGLLSIDIFGAAQICPEFASEFPFNISDLTLLVDYINEEIMGNITFHTIAGFPLGDVIVNFDGNETEISLTGHVNVIYGNYSGIEEINATTLEEMLAHYNNTIPGQGNESLYNMTDGMIECTSLNTTKTPTGPPEGARIDYNVTIYGNFTESLARIITEMFFVGAENETYPMVYAALNSTLLSVQNASLELNFYNTSKIVDITLTLYGDVKELWSNALQFIPPTVPVENQTLVEAWLKIANATAYAIENAYIEAIYSSDQQKLDLSATLTANVTKLEDDIVPFIPDAVPPELKEIFESYLNVTYCELSSLTASSNCTYGIVEFEVNWVLQGDFKAQVNHEKRFFIDFFSVMDPGMIGSGSQLFNATEIDINNFQMDVRQGIDWTTLTFKGLKMYPLKDEIDFIRFKLYQWLNMTSDPEAPPKKFEKLKITVNGGFNGTHTILLYAPGTVPTPDMTSLNYNAMTWENVTMSSLKDLLFKIAYQERIDYLGETYYVPIFTNSTVSTFNFDPDSKSMSFNVTGTTGIGFCNITIPRAVLYASLEEWVVRIDGAPLTLEEYNVTENAGYVFIYLNYSHSSHSIEITGTWIITELPPNMLPLIMVILSLIAVTLAVTQRKKLGAFKTKSQNVIRTFISKLYQSRT